jgi:hypothetical protein
MPFAPQKNLYLVYGWKVGVSERDIVLYHKGEEAMALGVSLTMSQDGQKFFIGTHLGTMDAKEGQDYIDCGCPRPLADVDLVRRMKDLGIKTNGNPMLYMIAG